jgi:NTP pyrophosphatase (non-canonical NTP hydrolase)
VSVPDYNPWQPMKVPKDLKVIGKLGEELCEAGAAVFRCVIQGIDEVEPVTKKPNRQWLTEEIADVLANVDLVIDHFGLDLAAIEARAVAKRAKLIEWHGML